MAKRKSCRPVVPEYDPIRAEAEMQVREAMMDTPTAKKLIRKTEKSIRKQRAETKRAIKKGTK